MAFDALTYSPILAPLEAGDTVTVPYPAGRSASDYTNGATGEHYGLIYGGRYDLNPTFGASNITFDWDYERVPVGSRIALQFERIAPPATLDEAATRTLSNIDQALALIALGLSHVDDTPDADKPISDATQDALDDKADAAATTTALAAKADAAATTTALAAKQALHARLTAISTAADSLASVLYAVGGDANTGIFGAAGLVKVAVDGVEGFRVYSPDGVNHHFGSPAGWDNITADGVRLCDFRYDADNHYLYVRGLVGAKDDNPWNDGGYRFNGPQSAPTKVLKGELIRISYAVGSRDSGRMAPVGTYGRCAEIAYIAAEDQTNTASGGLWAVSTTKVGTHAQPFNFWAHGLTGALVRGGLYAQDDMSAIVEYAGEGIDSIYHKNGSQKIKTVRNVTETNLSYQTGYDEEYVSTAVYKMVARYRNASVELYRDDVQLGKRTYGQDLGAKAFATGTAMVNNAAVSAAIPIPGGSCAVILVEDNSAEVAMYFVRTDASPAVVSMFATANFAGGTTTGAPAGGTGTASKLNVLASNNGNVYLSNRYGNRQLTWTVFKAAP